MSEVFRSEQRTAREGDQCGECAATIQPGTAYEAQGGIVDGRPWDQKLCLPCAALVAWCWNQYPSVFDIDGRELGNMAGDLENMDMVSECEDGPYVELEYRAVLEIDPVRNYPRLKVPAQAPAGAEAEA